MNVHSGAKTTPACREVMVRRVLYEGLPIRRVASGMAVSRGTVTKWVNRYRCGEGLHDRSSRPRRSPLRTPAEIEQLIVQLRRQPLTAVAISSAIGVPRSTVGRILRRQRLSRARDLITKEPARRYEHDAPGDLLHLDIKKLGKIDGVGHRFIGRGPRRRRGSGWEYAHVCVDDHSRMAYVEVLDDEQQHTTTGFLRRAVRWFGRLGVPTRRLLTDNGPAYRSRQFASACAELGVRHGFTRPYRPRTNGKAERFIQSASREWAYRQPYACSQERNEALVSWLHFYNHHRKHAAIGAPPASRVNNLFSSDS